MPAIILKFNEDLTPHEEINILKKALKILKENNIECEGFADTDTAYYYNQMEAVFSIIEEDEANNKEFLEFIKKSNNDETYNEFADKLSEYDDIIPFEGILDEVTEMLYRKYYEELYTEEYLSNMKLVNEDKLTTYSEIEEREKELVRDALINFQVRNKGRKHINRIELSEKDEFGIKIDIL